MFLSHDVGLGMGMATIVLAALFRVAYLPVTIQNVKKHLISLGKKWYSKQTDLS